MNHRALQRALIVAMYDPAWLAGARAGDRERLVAAGLGEPEAAVLLAVDERALRTDPLRRRRLLRTLAEEYKATTTWLLADTRALAAVDAFFASAAFRGAILGDRSLAVAFGDWLEGVVAAAASTPQLPGVLSLEATRARCRRASLAPAPAGVGLAPGVAVLSLDATVLPAVQTAERYLFEVGLMPQMALAADAPRLPPAPPLSGDLDLLLLQPADGEIALSAIDADLHGVLAALDPPRPRPAALAALAAAGVPAARAPALLDALVAEGLVAEARGRS